MQSSCQIPNGDEGAKKIAFSLFYVPMPAFSVWVMNGAMFGTH